MFPKQLRSKRTTKYTHIIIPKRRTLTFNIFTSNDIRLKRYKKSCSPSTSSKVSILAFTSTTRNPHRTQTFAFDLSKTHSQTFHLHPLSNFHSHKHHHFHQHHHHHATQNTHPNATEHLAPAQVLHTLNLLNHITFILPLFPCTLQDSRGLPQYVWSNNPRQSQSLDVFKDQYQIHIK